MAQSLGEYGALGDGGNSSRIANGLSNLLSTVEESLRNPTPRTFLMIGAFLFVLWFLFLRRRR